MSNDTIRRWQKNKNLFWVRVDRKCTQSGRPKFSSCEEIVSKVKEIVGRDARYTVHDVARMTDISLSRVHYRFKTGIQI